MDQVYFEKSFYFEINESSGISQFFKAVNFWKLIKMSNLWAIESGKISETLFWAQKKLWFPQFLKEAIILELTQVFRTITMEISSIFENSKSEVLLSFWKQ